jgi:hypothetical protein
LIVEDMITASDVFGGIAVGWHGGKTRRGKIVGGLPLTPLPYDELSYDFTLRQ